MLPPPDTCLATGDWRTACGQYTDTAFRVLGGGRATFDEQRVTCPKCREAAKAERESLPKD